LALVSGSATEILDAGDRVASVGGVDGLARVGVVDVDGNG
jgi:hypothetical protein